MRCLLGEEDRKRKYDDYLAVTQSCIGQILCAYMGGEWPLPEYGGFMYPERYKKEDTRSYEEIQMNLLKRLKE